MEKTTQWAFTAYEQQWDLFKVVPPLIAEWGWQTEVCPNTQRKHYQGWIRTIRQCRFSQISKLLPGVHIEPARDWIALKEYCKKKETAVSGTQIVQRQTDRQTKHMTMAESLILLARYADYDTRTIEQKLESVNSDDRFKAEYWLLSGEVLRQDPGLVAVYSQPQYLRSWVNYRSIWMEIAALSVAAEIDQTDRQTDGWPPDLPSPPPELDEVIPRPRLEL